MWGTNPSAFALIFPSYPKAIAHIRADRERTPYRTGNGLEFCGTPFVGHYHIQPGGISVPSHLLDHVVGVGSGAARAVAAQRAVDVGGEVVWEVRDLKAALQAGLPAQDAPEKRGTWPSVGKGICSNNQQQQDTHPAS